MLQKIISFLLVLASFPATAQIKIIDKFFSSDTGRHNSFLPVPAFSYTQEAGFIFGASGLYSFYIDKKDPVIRASRIQGVAYTSTKGQSQIGVKADIWSKENRFHHIYEAKFYNVNFNFYGIGNQTLSADKDPLKMLRYRLNAEIEKEILPHYYPGIGVEFESQHFTDKETGGIYTSSPVLTDRGGGRYGLVKITQLYDSRNSNTYPTRGSFVRLRLGYAPEIFGKDNFSGTLFTGDFRNFMCLSQKLVWGNQVIYENIASSKPVPFYALRQMGNDEMMRGYYMGRYRDKNYLAFQSELRWRFHERFGLVAFGGTGTVYGINSFSAKSLKPNYGIGGRFFFDLDKNLAVRLDYGMGEKPAGEKRISGFYIGLSEAF